MMGHRFINELVWARACERPQGMPVARPRGAKRLGLLYEKSLVAAFGDRAFAGKWFEFLDQNGPGWCQPDLIFARSRVIFVLECKYTWTPEGHSQIERLYKPVLELVFGVPVVGIQVCKRLVPEMPKTTWVTGDLDAAMSYAGRSPEKIHANVCWQWLGGEVVSLGEAGKRIA